MICAWLDQEPAKLGKKGRDLHEWSARKFAELSARVSKRVGEENIKSE